jgi:hypothetical protein
VDGSVISRAARLATLLQSVYRAELGELVRELSQTGRRGLRLLLWLVLVLALLFWGLGALLFAAGAALAPRLGAAASAAILGGVLVLLGAALAVVVMRRARALEAPTETVRRRLDAHLLWLNTDVLGRDDRDQGEESDGEDGFGPEDRAPRRTRWRERRDERGASEEESW